jgi:hypothetical protein
MASLANQQRGAQSSSRASEVTLPWFGLRIIRPMQSSAVRGSTADCVANLETGRRRYRPDFFPLLSCVESGSQDGRGRSEVAIG